MAQPGDSHSSAEVPRTHHERPTLLHSNTQAPGTAVNEELAENSPTRLRTRAFAGKFSGIGNISVKRLIPWIHKGGFAILDQELISGSNFLVSILLARWLVPEQYGAYAVAFGIFVLLSLVYQSLVLEPMAVFGGSSYRDCLRGYLRSLLWIHIAISLAIGIVFGASALVAKQFTHSSVLAGALAGVTFASPCHIVFLAGSPHFLLGAFSLQGRSGSVCIHCLEHGRTLFGVSSRPAFAVQRVCLDGRGGAGNRLLRPAAVARAVAPRRSPCGIGNYRTFTV